MRAVAGMTLAAQIVQYLNTTISSSGKSKFGIQFGAYASFASFFGLANLTAADADFYGVSDYTSSMAFELVTNASVSASAFPAAEDLSVRFLFHNGTASAISEPKAYPLFGGSEELVSWNDFVTQMASFDIGDTQEWCSKCQNTTGTCAAYTSSGSSSANASSSTAGASTGDQKSGNGLSPAVNGVIGAMVTLAVVLGLEALVLLAGGLKVVSKKTLAASSGLAHGVEPKA